MPTTPGPYDPRERQGGDDPDPDPSTTTGLEPGGGVPPGETPPAEGGTSGLSAPEAPAAGRKTTLFIAVGIVALAAIAALTLLVGRL